jgi:hypothetical protein
MLDLKVTKREEEIKDNAELQRSLEMEIIEMNRFRLLLRLRSKHAPRSICTRNKHSMSRVLADALQVSLGTDSLPTDLAAGVVAESKTFQEC